MLVQPRTGMLGTVQGRAAERAARPAGRTDCRDLLRERAKLLARYLAPQGSRAIGVGLLVVCQQHEQIVVLLESHRQAPDFELQRRSLTRIDRRYRLLGWRLG